MGTGVDRRIFVVGVPRSGTTLVQSLLASHSEMTSFTESHFFSRHFRLLPLASMAVLVRDPTQRVLEFLNENRVDLEVATSSRLTLEGWLRKGLPLPLQTRAVARRLLGVLDTLAMERGRSNWVEKTPRHLLYVPFLERVSRPECETHFVHVIRRGLDVVASLHRASHSWQHAYDLETCVKRWNDDVEFSLNRSSSSCDHFVFYEDLLAEPDKTLKQLLRALELGWQADVLDQFGEVSRRLITKDEAWKSDIDRGVRPSPTSGEALTDAQREQAAASLRPELYRRLYASSRAEELGSAR